MGEESKATAGGQQPQGNPAQGDNREGEQKKNYTEAEFQSEVDRRVNQALETARGKWKNEYDEKLKEQKTEAERLAKLSAEERTKEEFNKRVKEFEDKEAKYNAERLEFECTKLLAADGLPTDFAPMLTGADAQATKKHIAAFKSAYSKAVAAAVTQKLKGQTPRTPGSEKQTEDPFVLGFKKK